MYFIKIASLILLLAFASFKDLKTRTIPNRLVVCGMAAGIILTLTDFTVSAAFDAFMGFLVGGGILLAVSCISKGGIGMGDVKLMACTGVYLGLGKALGSLMLSIVFCGIFGVVLLFVRDYDRKAAVPFAPFIFIGVLTMLIQDLS